eukprot:g14917.t1
MGVEVCAEAAWDSLGEASKRWRVKRRGVEADPRHDPQCRKLTRVQALPSPSSGPTKRTTPTATAKSGRNFGNTYEDRCELQKYRDSEAGAERDSEGCECKVLAGPAQASNLQKRQRRRRHRGSLSNEALVGKLKGSIPKLVLLPQSVSWCLTQECGSVNAANHRYCGRISNSVEDGVADDTLEADAGGLLPAPHQPCDEAAQNRTSSTNVIGVCGISVGEGNPATISNTITTTNTTTTNNSGGWSSDGSFRDCSGSSRHTCGVGWGAPRGTVDGKVVVGLTAEVIKSPGVALDRSGRVTVVDKHMLAFDEVWPADLPALRPLRINLRRSCGALPRHGRHGKGKGQDRGGVTGFEGEGHRGPVFLMPMHREGKGVEGREDELFAEPPKLKRVDDETARNRDRYCFRDESRYGALSAEKSTKDRHSGDSSVERKWARCRLWETGVETWRWEWSPEARMMLGRLALWKGALLVSHTHAFVTGKGGPLDSTLSLGYVVGVFGLGMAGRVVVEGAPHPRGLLFEAYVPASCETCQLHVSVDDLKRLFWDDPQKMWVGKKGDMVVELVKMLYFEYTLETEVADSSAPDGIRLKAHRYSDREPWACLRDYRASDYDLHWESRRSTPARGGGEGPTRVSAINTQIAQVDGHLMDSDEARTGMTIRSAEGSDVGAETISPVDPASIEGPFAGGPGARTPLTEAASASVAGSHSVSSIPDERAVWVSQRLCIRSTQNLVDIDVEGTRAAIGPMGTKTKVRVKAFDMRVEEYKAQRRQAEEEKEARLRAWLAIKKRFRGLTLGTAVRVSGRLLALMVYEFPDQPGNLRVMFADAQSSETFRVSLGIGPVAALARHLSIAPSPENWTLGQRRRLIKNIIRERSAIVPVEEEEVDGSGHPGKAGARTHRRAIGQSLYCMVRCLGRESTASYVPAARTAAPGFARRRNAHQLQQPSPKDHRCLFPAVADRSEPIPLTFNSHEPQQATYAPLMEEAVREGAGTSVAAERGHDGVAAKNPPSKAARSAMGLVANCDPTDACSGLGRLRRLRPRRECGRGRRLCGGVARILGTPGLFSLLRGNWAGAEQEFVLEWYHPSGFRPSGCGPVEAHTTFSLRLLTQDLYLFTEGLDLMATAENWEPGGADTPIGDTPPPDRHSGAEIAGGKASPSSSHSERFGKARALGRGNEKEEPACTRTPLLTESEAWERVAREVFRRCFWKRTWFMTADDGRDQRLPHHRSPAGSAPNSLTLEEYVMSQASRTKPSGMESMIQEPPSAETEARVPSNVQLAIGTCVFRRVIKVAGLGVPPKYLLVIVSQLHDAFVVKCYDFVSGAIRQAERPDPDRDAALLLEFQNMSRLERDIQLQVMLDELLVYEDTAHAAEDSGSHWSVKFVQDANAPIVIDAGSNMYDQQVEEQMAAAAALVDKRREDMQRVQQAAREKDRRARERKNKRDEKRREAQAKSRKKKRESKRRGRTTRRGDDAQGTASEDTSEDSQGSDG